MDAHGSGDVTGRVPRLFFFAFCPLGLISDFCPGRGRAESHRWGCSVTAGTCAREDSGNTPPVGGQPPAPETPSPAANHCQGLDPHSQRLKPAAAVGVTQRLGLHVGFQGFSPPSGFGIHDKVLQL